MLVIGRLARADAVYLSTYFRGMALFVGVGVDGVLGVRKSWPLPLLDELASAITCFSDLDHGPSKVALHSKRCFNVF